MCEALGTEPIDSEIPVEYDDLSDDVQEAIMVYNMLQDNWDGMSGTYMGKVVSGISDIFEIAGIEDRKTCFSIIQIIDSVRSSIVNKKKPTK